MYFVCEKTPRNVGVKEERTRLRVRSVLDTAQATQWKGSERTLLKRTRDPLPSRTTDRNRSAIVAAPGCVSRGFWGHAQSLYGFKTRRHSKSIQQLPWVLKNKYLSRPRRDSFGTERPAKARAH